MSTDPTGVFHAGNDPTGTYTDPPPAPYADTPLDTVARAQQQQRTEDAP